MSKSKAELRDVNGKPTLDVFSVADDEDETTNFRGGTLTLSTKSSRPPATPASDSDNESSSSLSIEVPTVPISSASDRDHLKSDAISSLRNQKSTSLDSATTTQDAAKKFFAIRVGAFDNAVEASRSVVLSDTDGEFRGAWLLTKIGHWDTEKERLLILTNHSLLIVKYDFIALSVLEYHRLSLSDFDRVIVGNFTYPQASVVPKIDKLIRFVDMWSKLKQTTTSTDSTSTTVVVGSSSLRQSKGVRIMWNKGNPIKIYESWNPWSRNIPFATFTSHPLAAQSEDSDSSPSNVYDIENFIQALEAAIKNVSIIQCRFEEKPIIIQNYLGLTALLYNINNLGFFKSRGRFSF